MKKEALNTKQRIMHETTSLFAEAGYESFSMRTLAKRLKISQSVLYHHFGSKKELLEETFDTTRKNLGKKRPSLEQNSTLYMDIYERTCFQMDNALDVTFIFKYYLHFREEFEKNSEGYVPKTAYKHILEILEKAQKNGEIKGLDLDEEAKVITHAINGFVLEYYPKMPKGHEREKVVNSLTNFIHRSLVAEKKGVNKNGRKSK